MNDCLVIVDVQNDFVEGGALAVNGGKEVANRIVTLLKEKNYAMKVFTQDWHPTDHCSFKEQGGPWPAHCVQGTFGGEVVDCLLPYKNFVFFKGKDKSKEEYGADIGYVPGIDRFDVVGIALDYCVQETAKSIKRSNPNAQVNILSEYCAAISGLSREVLLELKNLGINVLSSGTEPTSIYKTKKLSELLAKELLNISDEVLKNKVIEIIDTQTKPCHAWKPASSSGKYHPTYAAGDGGLIRHIKVTVQNLLTLIQATPLLEPEKDTLVAAAILHDMCKYENSEDHTDNNHPNLMGDKMKAAGLDEIARLIYAHHGIWCYDKYKNVSTGVKPEKMDEWILHYSDLFASKIYLRAEFDQNGDLITTRY